MWLQMKWAQAGYSLTRACALQKSGQNAENVINGTRSARKLKLPNSDLHLESQEQSVACIAEKKSLFTESGPQEREWKNRKGSNVNKQDTIVATVVDS